MSAVIIVVAILFALASGAIIRWIFARSDSRSYRYRLGYQTNRISAAEFVVVGVIMAIGIVPLASIVGTQLSIGEQLRYEQFVNGVEVYRNSEKDPPMDAVTNCRSGQAGNSKAAGQSNCKYAYISGDYWWTWVEYVTTCKSDNKGNQDCKTEPVTHTEHDYIYTPYATREHTYTIYGSMGGAGTFTYVFPDVYLDAQPVRHPQSTRDIPANLLRGAPADWLEALAALDAGTPRSITKMANYENFILASKDDVLATYGPRLDEYKAAGLLPDHTKNITTDPITGPSKSQADKVSFVGVAVRDEAAWQRSVMRFNAALGMKLQGDLHVVLINAASVPWLDAVPYTQSLKAYWQSETFGRRAIAKNGIILVLGVDTATNTVAWANASTGMPFGNELMIQYLQDNLPGTNLEPDVLFGKPVTVIDGNNVTVTNTEPQGKVEQIVFEQATFKRFSMSCKKESCIGYDQLIGKIKPTPAAEAWVLVSTTVAAIALWVLVGFTRFVDNGINWCREHVLPQGSRSNRSTRSNRREEY